MRFKKSGNFAAGMVSRSLPEVSKEVLTFSKITNGIVGDYGEFQPIQDDDTAGGERFRDNFPVETKVKTFRVSFDGVACVLTVPIGPTYLYQHTLDELVLIPTNNLFFSVGSLTDPTISTEGFGPTLNPFFGKFNFQITLVEDIPISIYTRVLATPLAIALYSYNNRVAGGDPISTAKIYYENFVNTVYAESLHDMLDVSEVIYLTDNSYLILNKDLPPLILKGRFDKAYGYVTVVIMPAHVATIPSTSSSLFGTQYYSAKSYPWLPLNTIDSDTVTVSNAGTDWATSLGSGPINNASGIVLPIMNYDTGSLFKSSCLKTIKFTVGVNSESDYRGLSGAFVKVRSSAAVDNVYYLLALVDDSFTIDYMAMIVVGDFANISANKNFAITEWNTKYGFPHTGCINSTLGGRLMLSGSKAFQKSIWMAAVAGSALGEDSQNPFVFMQADALLTQDATTETSGLKHYDKTKVNTKGLVTSISLSSYGAITKIFERRKLHIFTEEGTYVADYNNAVNSEAGESEFLSSSQPQTSYRTLKYMAFTAFNSGVLYADANNGLHFLSTADKDYESVDTIISYQYDFLDGIGEIEALSDNLALIKSKYDIFGFKYHFMKLSPKGSSAFTLLDTGDVENIVGHCFITKGVILLLHVFHDTRTVSIYIPNNLTGYGNKRLGIYALPKIELHPIVVTTRLGDSFGSPMKIDRVFFDLVDSTNGVSIGNRNGEGVYKENNQYSTESSGRYLDGDYADCATSYGVTPKFIMGYEDMGVAVNALGFTGNVEEEN